MTLNKFGQIAEQEILKTEAIRYNIEIDKYAIMPNHIHLIIVISGTGTARRVPTVESFGKPTKHSIPTIIRSIKSAITRQINKINNTLGQSAWQHNYYEHVVRTEESLNRIRRYIINNPAKWTYDRHNRNSLSINDKQQFWSRFLNEFSE